MKDTRAEREAGTRRTQGRWYPTHGEQQEQPSLLPGSDSSDAPRSKTYEDLKKLLPTLAIGSHSNARCQPLPEAGAQRTLEAVGCTPWLGGSIVMTTGMSNA
jgi:hypothetical protein